MNEFELLDFIITKYDTSREREKKHVILLPFYTGEESRLEFEIYYHEKMGISVVPYEKNKLGYGQLYEVIKEWNKKINLTSTYLYESYQEIEKIVDQYGK